MLRTLAGLLYAGSLWLSNSAYLYLSVSFIQMTKSLMPGLVYASGVFLGTERFSKGVTGNMLLIAFGVVVCAIGELNLVIGGLVQQLTALLFEAMRLTMVQVRLLSFKLLLINLSLFTAAKVNEWLASEMVFVILVS